MVANETIAESDLTKPNAKNRYEVTQNDVPVHCPMTGSSLWNSHPKVYIALDKNGEGMCPYCGAEYHLKK